MYFDNNYYVITYEPGKIEHIFASREKREQKLHTKQPKLLLMQKWSPE